MSTKKRKSDVTEVDSTNVKRPKVDDFLRLNDADLKEDDYDVLFRTIAHRLLNDFELVINKEHSFRLSEIEFYYYHSTRHADTFAHRHPEQVHPSNWYFHRQGTSNTASYKAGTYKGLDITFSSSTDTSFGGILLRSIKNKQTGQVYEGSCLVVDAILNLCNSETIKDLVETKLQKCLHVFNVNDFLYLRPQPSTIEYELVASPRVGLTLKVPSIDRERFLFRSYRFTSNDYYPSKMKMTILLALVADRYFQNNQTKQFLKYAGEISKITCARPATLQTNLEDLQKGYEMDVSNKSSPLVDFYKKKWTTSELAKAYGIWLATYRSKC